MRASVVVTLVVLTVISLVGALYMSFGVLGIASTNKTNRMTLMLSDSGGLMQTSNVTMRGIKIGRVTDVQATKTGLAVSMALDSGYPVPVDSAVSVNNLSAAGEQYIEFTPTRIEPPYWGDGAVIPADKVAPTYTVSDLLAKGNALMSTLDADDLKVVLDNVATGVMDNTPTIDHLADTTRLFAQMIQDDKQELTNVIGNTAKITQGLGALDAGQVLKRTAATLPSSVGGLIIMMRVLEKLEPLAEDSLMPGRSLSMLVDKIVEYGGKLAGPMTEFVTVLEPIVAPLRDVKVDAGHWLDFWDSTFSSEGSARVHLGVPEWSDPGLAQPVAQPGGAQQPPLQPKTGGQPATAGRPTP